ncbi:uncharacterized protein LOC142554466 isoform X2 [Primulina tabacum]|uniref:uncharacterized protein LOC142554466 isoform X2 n=1 Tax=Primulina tabacum TaxID=48773 RepID=UPI003F59F819
MQHPLPILPSSIILAQSFILHHFCRVCFSPSVDLNSTPDMEMDLKFMAELEAMGFSKAQAIKALCSGNSSIEAAINWIIDHENDTTRTEMPTVPAIIPIEAVDSNHISELVKLRAQALRKQAHQKKANEERKQEREHEKERIQAGKELLEAKQLAEEMDKKRFMAQRRLEKEEERRARERVRQKLQQDKLERRSMLGLPSEGSTSMNLVTASPQKLSIGNPALLPVKPIAEREIMRECLRCLKHQNKEDNTSAIRAFDTLLIYVRNVVNNPDGGKFRKIRINNSAFQDRVGKFEEGVKFLQLCGFEIVEGGKFLCLAREKVHMERLITAGNELQNALTNPFFGLLST